MLFLAERLPLTNSTLFQLIHMPKVIQISLTTQEVIKLKSDINSWVWRFINRAKAILLLDKGESPTQVANKLGVAFSSVTQWKKVFLEKGIDLFLSSRKNVSKKIDLSASQRAHLEDFCSTSLSKSEILRARAYLLLDEWYQQGETAEMLWVGRNKITLRVKLWKNHFSDEIFNYLHMRSTESLN